MLKMDVMICKVHLKKAQKKKKKRRIHLLDTLGMVRFRRSRSSMLP